jgi:hypothetical protein
MIKLKGMIILIIFILSSFSSLSGVVAGDYDDLTPEQKILDHIKTVGKCGDLEAGMVLSLMADHSVNHEDLDFYIRYLSGNDTEANEQFNSVRYHDYYVFWEGYLKDWSQKTLQEKAQSLNIKTATFESTTKILEDARGYGSVFIMEYITPTINKINDKAVELSKSVECDIGTIKRLTGELKDLNYEYLDSIQEADIAYKMSSFEPDNLDYKNAADKIFKNDSLSKNDKVFGLEALKKDYEYMYQEINTKYNLVDGMRKSINTHGQTIIGIGGGLTGVGIGLIIAGAFGPAGAVSVIVGIALCIVGVILLGVGGALCDGARVFTKATLYMLDYQSEFGITYDQAVGYIDGCLKLL